MASLRSPEDLCERLGLRPTPKQRELMRRFYEEEDPLHAEEIPSENTLNAVAMAALWRLLREHGSKCIVISSDRSLEKRFLGFLHDLTTTIDPALTSVCRWSSSKCLRVGDAAGHELRMVSNKPEWLQGLHSGATTFVVLGAGGSETAFVETLKVVETYRRAEGARHIYLW